MQQLWILLIIISRPTPKPNISWVIKTFWNAGNTPKPSRLYHVMIDNFVINKCRYLYMLLKIVLIKFIQV
jgi:hypothetical protein